MLHAPTRAVMPQMRPKREVSRWSGRSGLGMLGFLTGGFCLADSRRWPGFGLYRDGWRGRVCDEKPASAGFVACKRGGDQTAKEEPQPQVEWRSDW